MKFLRLTILLVASFVLFSCKNENTQPNIVVILCDDLGYGDLSSFGHPIIQTPNLDAMASKGIKLTNFYSAAPVCSPSRVGLMTGRSPNRAGVYDFIPGPRKSEDLRDLVHMQAQEQTIPALLKNAGYATCLSGKWHCNSQFNKPEQQPTPGDFGFDHWFATHNNAAPSHENPKNFVRNGEDVGEIEGFSCQIVVDEALNWLKGKETDNPFYLQVTFHEPHEPIASPRDLVQKYMPQSDNENQAQYFANVENMDKAVGRLIEYLEANYGENTLVLFSSDNGPETLNRYSRAKRSFGSPGDLKGMKLWTTEAGFRVPGIMYWMGKKTFKGTSDAVISSLDFLPTFCELSGSEIPQNELDGESISSFLKTGELARSKPLVWAFYNALNDRRVAMRHGDWKMMAMLKNDTTELPKINNLHGGNESLVKGSELTNLVLFNLKNDLGEVEDLSLIKPDQFSRMKSLLEKEYKNLLAGSHIWSRTNKTTQIKQIN